MNKSSKVSDTVALASTNFDEGITIFSDRSLSWMTAGEGGTEKHTASNVIYLQQLADPYVEARGEAMPVILVCGEEIKTTGTTVREKTAVCIDMKPMHV